MGHRAQTRFVDGLNIMILQYFYIISYNHVGDRMKNKTITTRVPEDLFREIKEIGEMEKIDRTEVVKRLLSNAAKHWKIERALNLLRDGKVTLRRAAKIAEVTYVEMLDLSSQMDIAIKMGPEDVINDLKD